MKVKYSKPMFAFQETGTVESNQSVHLQHGGVGPGHLPDCRTPHPSLCLYRYLSLRLYRCLSPLYPSLQQRLISMTPLLFAWTSQNLYDNRIMLNMRTLNSAWTTYSKLSTIRYDKNWQSRYFDLKYRSDSKHYFIAMPSLWLHLFKVQYYEL